MAKPIAGGSLTALIYGYIRDSLHTKAIKILEEQLLCFPESQAALSLLGYCDYYLGDFCAAASAYEKLVQLQPMEQKYQIYLAQSLYKASMLGAAEKACLAVNGHCESVETLKACIKYEQHDIAGSRQIWDHSSDEDLDATINLGCCLYKVQNSLSSVLITSIVNLIFLRH
ncbi:hypothetical protein L7F22_028547 [Adiantum nelumboides]|nr:hypothetical protein [Adiantum nelumboides]